MQQDKSYRKRERLKSRKLIAEVFEHAKVVKAYPLRAHFWVHDQSEYSGTQVGVSVSKRYFKKAVDRNRVKRLMREAYRHNKLPFISEDNAKSNLAVMIIYNSNEIVDFQQMNYKMKALIGKVTKLISS